MKNLIQKFCDRRYLKVKHPTLKIDVDPISKREFVFIDDLHLIVRFWGYLKYQNRVSENHIFIRGQVKDYGNMIPSLFRGDKLTKERIQRRLKAYQRIKEGICKIYKAARFQGEIGGATLQHYGLKTPWLDLVDNIFIGLWFARNEMKWIEGEKTYEIKNRQEEYGWIFLLKTNFGKKMNNEGVWQGGGIQWCDLRYMDTDLSLRPHFQHGIFISKSNYSEDNFDLNDEIIATIKFPIKLKNDIEDVKPKHIFPSTFYDNTYKYLIKPKVNKMIKRVEEESGLNDREIGRIFTVKT